MSINPKQYERQSFETGYRPNKAPNYSAPYERQNAQLRAQEQQMLSQIAANDRVRIENAKKTGEFWSDLGVFSNKAMEVGQQFLEQAAKDKATGASYDAFFGNQDLSQAEQETVELARENEQVARVSERVEAEQGPVAGSRVKRELGDRASGFRGEQAAVMQARSQYSSWLANYLSSNEKITVNGKTLTVREAVQSGDPALTAAAIQQGRYNFIKEQGLYRASKDVLVKNLMQPMMAVESALGGTLTTKAIQSQRDETLRGLSAEAYQADGEDLQATWDSLANRFYTEDTGLTRAEANERALDALLAGMVARRDLDAIRDLRTKYKIKNPDGTYNTSELLGSNYYEKFDRAEADAQRAENSYVTGQGKAIEAQLYKELREATTPEQRQAAILKANAAYISIGLDKKARDLMLDRDELVVSEMQDFNNAELERGIADGSVTNTEDIDKAVLRGSITEAQGKALKATLLAQVSVEDPKNKTGKSLAEDFKKRFRNRFLPAVGLRTDITGAIFDIDGSTKIVDKADAQIILGQANRDINAVVNRVIASNPGIEDNPQLLQQKVTEALNDWYRINVDTNGGKYQLNDLEQRLDADQGKAVDGDAYKKYKNRFSSLIDDSSDLTRTRYPQGRQVNLGRDLVSKITVGEPISPQVKAEFNQLRKDKVITRQRLVEEVALRKKYGAFSSNFMQLADGLGMSPLSLANHQLYAYDINENFVPSDNVQITNMKDGAQYLMGRGFPVRGAAYLSGNIQQESGWYGQRQPWDDGGALSGGLVSWRAGRLDAMESSLGEVETVNNKRQLDYMIQELRTKYPQAYRIFMNPYATQRQLIRASKIFWGYGEEGKRYQYAEETLKQFN